MQTLKLSHDQFMIIMASNPDLLADSAHYEFFSAFFDLLFCDGGDDAFASENSNYIALLMTCLLPYRFIEDYDNASEQGEQEIFEAAYQFLKTDLV